MGVGDNHHPKNGRARKAGAAAAGKPLLPKKAAKAAMDTLKVTIPSESPVARKVEEQILELVFAKGFNNDSIFALRLAIQEALQNAIKHGNRGDPSKKVKIEARVSPRQAEISIEDEGVGFVREGVPDPRHEENLEKCSGRGIFLIESYMNQVKWSHGGRRLTMVRKNQPDSKHVP
jgi:serine/threonine-protein kinase RsbW